MIQHFLLACFSEVNVRFSIPALNQLYGLQVCRPQLKACLGNPSYSIEPGEPMRYTGFVVGYGSTYYPLELIYLQYLYSGHFLSIVESSVRKYFLPEDASAFLNDLNSGYLNDNIRSIVFRALYFNTTVKEQLKQEFNLSCVKS